MISIKNAILISLLLGLSFSLVVVFSSTRTWYWGLSSGLILLADLFIIPFLLDEERK